MRFKKFFPLLLLILFIDFGYGQEGLPVYTDYLTDNYYLIHPSMAGAANCAKLRLTGRQQWSGRDAPGLFTMSVNGKIGESQSGLGAILYTDKNGYHSQNAAYLTYAHHLMFSRDELDLNMLSFGLSAGVLQHRLNEGSFEEFDPIVTGQLQNATDFNIDLGLSYHLYDFYAHATAKNFLKDRGVNDDRESTNNFRRYLLTVGAVLDSYDSKWSFEPSVMFMHKGSTQESSFDVNLKTYREMKFGSIWGGLSYRRSVDKNRINGGSGESQHLQHITPLLGVNYKGFVFAYNYTYQANSTVYNKGGFHQLTLGIDFSCRKKRYKCNCPAVNG